MFYGAKNLAVNHLPQERGLAVQTWTSNRSFDDKAPVTWFLDFRKSRKMPKNLNLKVSMVGAYTWASLRERCVVLEWVRINKYRERFWLCCFSAFYYFLLVLVDRFVDIKPVEILWFIWCALDFFPTPKVATLPGLLVKRTLWAQTPNVWRLKKILLTAKHGGACWRKLQKGIKKGNVLRWRNWGKTKSWRKGGFAFSARENMWHKQGTPVFSEPSERRHVGCRHEFSLGKIVVRHA